MSTFKLCSTRNWKLPRAFEGMEKWILIQVNASRLRVKGQLTVTDKSTIHEDQIIEIQCSMNPSWALLS